MKVKQTDFGNGNVSSLIIRVSIPMILAELVNLLYSMVDRIYIGHIPGDGSLALTGLGLCFPIISLCSAFGRLFGFNGGAPLCAMERGRGDDEEASAVMGNSFSMALITGAILTILLSIFTDPILYAFGASSETISYARDYMSIYAIGTIPVLITLSMNAFINSQGFASIGMVTILIGAVLNIILDPIFIFHFSMGVKGAAFATLISQIASATFVMLFLKSKYPTLPLTLSHMCLKWNRCKKILTLGFSGFTMGATNSIVQIVCNKAALMWGGDLYVGVMTVVNSIREVFATPVNGLGAGSGPVMSYNYGANDGERVMKASNFTLAGCMIIACTISIFTFIIPETIASLFTSDPEMIKASGPIMRLYFSGFAFMAFQTAGQQTFVALGKAKQAVFFSIFRKVIIVVPLTIILPYALGIYGVALAEPISNVIGGLAAYITMRKTVFPELKKMLKA